MTQSAKLSTRRTCHALLMPKNPTKDEKSRVGYFIEWLASTGRDWYDPDLKSYRDYLLNDRTRYHSPSGEMRPATLSRKAAISHLATVRGRYYSLLRNNKVRQLLYDVAPDHYSPADKKAFVDELLARLQNAVHPTAARIKIIEKQDEAESEALRLKPHQVRALLRAPGLDDLRAIRDTAMIAMLVCTGIREAELCNLDVSDLRQYLRDELALRIRAGKGFKQRLIPYGPLDWCLVYVDRWLHEANIKSGVVFRGLYKGHKRVRKTGITTRSVNRIMNGYPIMIDGELREVKPHDLRRTYARNAYEGGLDIERIRQNLGHVSLQTTQGYIGALDATQRRPPDMFAPPHNIDTIARW